MTSIDVAPDRLDPESSLPVVSASETPGPPEVDQRRPAASETPQGRRRDALTVAAIGLTIFGLVVAAFLVYLLGISALEHGRAQRTLRAAFHRDVKFGNAWIGGQIPQGAPVAELAIKKLGVHEIVIEGTTSAALRRGPGHLRTAPLPGQPGNVVIAGRRVTYGGPFRHIDQLKRGDSIVATTGQGRATYRVTRVMEIDRHSPDAVDNFGDNRLTLITSTPEFQATRRLVVTATLRSALRPVPAAQPTDIRPDELGLNSDHSTAFALLLWAQALLIASLGAAWLGRRWRLWPTYVVVLPVLALLLLLVFDSFAPVLPSTL